MTLHKSNPRGLWRGWLALFVPLLLLSAEIGLLTLLVEYRHGPMAAIAQPLFVQAVLIATTALLLVSGAQLAAVATPGSLAMRATWLAINVCSFALLLWMSIALAQLGRSTGTSPTLVAAWIGLSLAVGITAILAGTSWKTIETWARIAWLPALLAITLGVGLALLTPSIRRLWSVAGAPTARVAKALLEFAHPGQTVLELPAHQELTIGLKHATRPLKLMVTAACSELESLAAFLLLAVTLLVARWKQASFWRWLAAATVGLVLLWLLCAARLALLVEVGVHFAPRWSTQLAHSRASGIFFLTLSAAWLVLTSNWWQSASQAAPSRGESPGPTSCP